MDKRNFRIIIIIVMLVFSASVFAQNNKSKPETIHSIELPEISVELRDGDGKEKVKTSCNICHSLDYITTQPRFQKTQWTATVNKMIKVYGAPINDEDTAAIIDYLTKNYGTGD